MRLFGEGEGCSWLSNTFANIRLPCLAGQALLFDNQLGQGSGEKDGQTGSSLSFLHAGRHNTVFLLVFPAIGIEPGTYFPI